MSLLLILIWLHSLCHSHTILQSQSTDYALTLAASPYIVNSFVIFSSSAHIVIENGVQIIFIGNKFISVFGSLDCGCSAPDTINNHTKGLSNPSLFIHIFGNESMPTSTGIFINQQNSLNPPIIQFCNTLFDNIQNGIVTTSNQYIAYTVHNCEFRSINNAIHHSTNIINFVFNSYFHQINNVKSAGGVIYDHCLFHSFGKFSFNTAKAIDIAIRNSEIYGDDAQICLNINSITGDPMYAIYNNTISRCKDGIEIWNAVGITHNRISHCSRYGIFAQGISDTLHITHNIFTNNGGLDVKLHDVQRVNVAHNRFKSDIAALYMDGVSCSMCNITQNHFIGDLQQQSVSNNDYIVSISNCVDVKIVDNLFMHKYNTYGAIYCEGDDDHHETGTVQLLSNVFMNNSVQYLITMEHNTAVVIHNNTVIHCHISGHLMESINTNSISLSYNQIQDNMACNAPFLNIQNTNYFAFEYNSFAYNELNSSYFIQSEDNTQVSIEHNQFIANNGVTILYLYKSYSAHIAYNIFDVNVVTHDIYLDYLNDRSHTERVMIEYNAFMSGNTDTFIEIDGDTMRNQYIEIHINWNDFYDHIDTQYFIHSDSMDIDANHNYWSGWITFTQIALKISNICTTVHVTNANEEPLDLTHPNVSQCSWNMTDSCSSITRYTCDSHTTPPTPSVTITLPTISPPTTITPTQRIIIASAPTQTTATNTQITQQNIESTPRVPRAETIVQVENRKDSRFSVVMISISFGCAVLCLVSCEILWCIRKQNDKERMMKCASQHHFSFSDSYQVNFNDIALHRIRHKAYILTNQVSGHAVSMEDLKEEEEEEVEGDPPPMIRTISHGLGELELDNEFIDAEEEYDVFGIKIAHDEFIIGSLPKVTKGCFGEGEQMKNEDSDDDGISTVGSV
eukprot:564082_1